MPSQGEMPTPPSILIIGTGVFGLTTLLELLQRPKFKDSKITVVSPSIPASLSPVHDHSVGISEASLPHIASNDLNRIIRIDYADKAYAALMGNARTKWLETPGLSDHYHDSGLLLTADAGTSAMRYVTAAWENMKAQGRQIKKFVGERDKSKAMRVPGKALATGEFGYLNEQSGWAEAGACLGWLWDQVSLLSKSREIRFVRNSVQSLAFSPNHRRVTGAVLANGDVEGGDLTLLATGAWTPALIDMRGIASARGQCMVYVDIDEEHAKNLQDMPIHFNMSRGCVVFCPARKPGGGWEIKLAFHGFGYSNPQSALHGNSLPTFAGGIPAALKELLLEFLKLCLPTVDFSSLHVTTRLCWYLDTATSDFLACYHPELESLFVATGGSGHAFKFLPVLGKSIVDVLDGTDAQSQAGFWTQKWAWPSPQRDANGDIVTEVWCRDGSRAGVPGISLQEALADDQKWASRVRSKL